MAKQQADWDNCVRAAVQAGEEDQELDAAFQAKAAALEASATLIKTMKQQLQALEDGALGEVDRDTAEQETDDMLKTIKLKLQEMHFAETEDSSRALARREATKHIAEGAEGAAANDYQSLKQLP